MNNIELKNEFISYINHLIQYWDNENVSSRTKLEGLSHSILVAIDGGAGGLDGGYELRPIRNEEVKEDIGGYLHELLFKNKK